MVAHNVAVSEWNRKQIPGSEGVRILSWAEVQEIVDRFISLNPYDPNAVKGSILNLVDATFADSHSNKSQRQLYRYSIAAKRYTLYVKTRKSEIDIIDPKAHGVAFLYPPKNSPKRLGRRYSTMDLWNVGLHRAEFPGAEMYIANLGRDSANDASECQYI